MASHTSPNPSGSGESQEQWDTKETELKIPGAVGWSLKCTGPRMRVNVASHVGEMQCPAKTANKGSEKPNLCCPTAVCKGSIGRKRQED